ncbi:glucose-1-phosphate adenylyltransferase subunit GlgD [Bacillus sp. 3255]|uniref:glucose-1-phosphate adenylyltransferase subunit GlgD n=1 Tax=Bacillus sp. 3255 TaxID=2817904 RepID=UPI00285FA22D|nr:glucose-1-phosphate adenylyltransferase subunit GlgD [Bacillus sp. 3255]MDR6882855.1 glucose-1-phosphate adenylyltransferase [Bacillus sp. 3255]
MEHVLGMIDLMNDGAHLSALTRCRCTGAVPFGGRYRLADFALSNLSRAGIRKVAVLPSPKADSLLRHMGDGRHHGLETLETLHEAYGDWPYGRNCLDALQSRQETYVLIAPSSVIYLSPYERMMEDHIGSGADITVLYKHWSELDSYAHMGQAYRLEMNEHGRVVQAVPAYHALPDQSPQNIGLDTFIMKRDLLIDLGRFRAKQQRSLTMSELVWAHLDELDVHGFMNHGYAANIDSIDSYYAHSMHLLQPQGWRQFMQHQEAVYTRPNEEQAIACHPQALIRNAFVAPGCRIEGYVENSILFAGVAVQPGAQVRNSVIMHDCVIEAGAVLDKVILDKEVTIERETVVRGEYTHPYVGEKHGVLSS